MQIQTSGYGPLNDDDAGKTALIVRQHAVGSGVIVDSNGYIMTNAHVVEGAQRIRCGVADAGVRVANATLLPAGDRSTMRRWLGPQGDRPGAAEDRPDEPATLSLEESQNIRVGQMVLAVGSPKGCRVRSRWE